MAPEPPWRRRLLHRLQAELEQSLSGAYGAETGLPCVPVALNVLTHEHLTAADLLPFVALPDDAAEARWYEQAWAQAHRAVLEAEPVQDCIAVIRARLAGPGKPAFDAFCESCWAWLHTELRQSANDPVGEEVPQSAMDDQVQELAEARLFLPMVEADRVLHRLRDDSASTDPESGALKPPRRSRAKTSGHAFLDALLKYDPNKGGYWRTFLMERYGYKWRDARRALHADPEMEPLDSDIGSGPMDASGSEDVAETSLNVDPDSLAAPVSADPNSSCAEEDSAFAVLRRSLVAAQVPAPAKPGEPPVRLQPAQVEKQARAEESLAILEISYTAYVDPTTYSAPTLRRVPEAGERLALEAKLRERQRRWWPVAAGPPPWNELLPAAKALAASVSGWTRLLTATDPKQAESVDAALANAAANPVRATASLADPANLAEAAHQCVALCAGLMACPMLEELRRDYTAAERLHHEEEERYSGARTEQTERAGEEKELQRSAVAEGLPRHEARQAQFRGRKYFEDFKKAPPASSALLEQLRTLETELAADDLRLKQQQSGLSASRRRQMEFELFQLSVGCRPVEALKREIQYLERHLSRGSELNESGETRLPARTLTGLRQQILSYQITLASVRFALCEREVENLGGPDSNVQRYRERKKYRERDQTPPVRQDRSDRFWIRAQKEVQRFLPGFPQPKVARRLIWIEEQLAAFAETGEFAP